MKCLIKERICTNQPEGSAHFNKVSYFLEPNFIYEIHISGSYLRFISLGCRYSRLLRIDQFKECLRKGSIQLF